MQGTRDIAAYLAVPAAIAFLEGHDWPAVWGRCHALLGAARRAVEDLTGLPALAPHSGEWYAQMASFPLPPGDGAALHRRLSDEFAVEVPVVTWGGRTFVRVSVQGYNSREDIATLVAALRALLPPRGRGLEPAAF